MGEGCSETHLPRPERKDNPRMRKVWFAPAPPAPPVQLISHTREPFVDQDLNLYATVLRTSGFGLVRCCGAVLSHCARCHNVSDGYIALLHQISDNRFGTVFAQFCIHRSVAGCISVTHHFDDVSSQASRSLRQLLQLFLVFGCNLRTAYLELYRRLTF